MRTPSKRSFATQSPAALIAQAMTRRASRVTLVAVSGTRADELMARRRGVAQCPRGGLDRVRSDSVADVEHAEAHLVGRPLAPEHVARREPPRSHERLVR